MMPIGSIIGGALVWAMEPVAGREWALRIPYLVAAASSVGLYIYVLPRLNSAKIAEARQLSFKSSTSSSVDSSDSA